jgi:phage tail sheath gpL-like
MFSAATRPSILTLAQTANASGVFYLVPGSDSFDGIVQAGQSVAMRIGQSGTATQAGVYNISVWGTPYDMFVTQPEGSNTFGSAVY